MELKDTQAALEAILFASGEPVGVERLCLTLELDRETVDELCSHLADQYSYERRGLRVLRLDNAWQMASAPEYADLIRQTFESRKPAKLSQPALEVLSIIAYFQPTTRAYVDQVRGVDSSYTVGLLLERELIEECGRLAVPGRPILYRTTKNFLRSFSLSSLDELPELPNSTAEDGQLTLEIQANIEKLRAQQELADISDDELLEAAAKLAAEEAAQTLDPADFPAEEAVPPPEGDTGGTAPNKADASPPEPPASAELAPSDGLGESLS
ncbi:MAG: SMC-Scp complex subunit ScpB [Oscillospiraceae bacterium]|jgi:segregation and condensation protein B